jgi:hypothetical protein
VYIEIYNTSSAIISMLKLRLVGHLVSIGIISLLNNVNIVDWEVSYST